MRFRMLRIRGENMKKAIVVLLSAVIFTCMADIAGAKGAGNKKSAPKNQIPPVLTENSNQSVKSRVTFVELGSVNCIPCKAMQPVMKAIEAEYGNQVKVVFYDVWTAEGSPYGKQYRIRVIPTQVFLDKDGKEFFRHEGFFPKEEIAKVLETQGVKNPAAAINNASQEQQNDKNVNQGAICK